MEGISSLSSLWPCFLAELIVDSIYGSGFPSVVCASQCLVISLLALTMYSFISLAVLPEML